MAVLRDIWANYRDESFISQFLSPRLMRQMRMFHLHDDPAQTEGIRVEAIHNERGYRRVRRQLARQYDVGLVDRQHRGRRRRSRRRPPPDAASQRRQRRPAERADAKRVLQHLADLWSYDVLLQEIDATGSGPEGAYREPARDGGGCVARGDIGSIGPISPVIASVAKQSQFLLEASGLLRRKGSRNDEDRFPAIYTWS